MKDFLNYYHASKENKYKVYLFAVLIYLFLYLVANPHAYDIYLVKFRMFSRDVTLATQGLISRFEAKNLSPSPSVSPQKNTTSSVTPIENVPQQ